MKPRRILIFSLAYYPNMIGGAEVAVKEITDRISLNEVEFDMITLRASDSTAAFQKIGNVNVHWVGRSLLNKRTGQYSFSPSSKTLFPLTAFWKAIQLQRKNKYDATWSVMANRAGFAALFFKLTHPRIPFILTLQEGDPPEETKKRVGIVYPLFKMIFTRADSITAISKFLADWAKSMGAKAPIKVIPNGVDYERFSRPIDAELRKKLRTELGVTDADHVLVTTSRLVRKNAVDTLIGSLEILDRSCKALIIGSGEEETALKNLAKTLKVDARTIFEGQMTHEYLVKYLKASDIFVRPSRSEGLGNSFLEAMAAGIPVIGTRVGGIVDFLKDGETGLICEVDNPRSVAQKVEKLIKDKESREYLIRQAKEMVKEKYEWKKIAEEIKNVLTE